MLALPLVLAFAAFLIPVGAHGTCYVPLCCTTPPVQGTTHIESVSPQVALPGVTIVYIQGYCFGDSQGSGSIKLSGEPMTDIIFWTDAEIAFRPLFDATSGNLVVTSSSYGSDSTALEADCPGSPPGYTPDYCGNDKVNATFSIAPVGPPVYPAAVRNMTAWAPEYVQGVWYYDDGGQTMTLTLNQGPFNATNGTWPITGTEVTNWAPGQVYNVSGTLDQYGDFALGLPVVADNVNCIEWQILGSGDVTSQGLGIGCTGAPPVPTQNFLDGYMDSAEGAYYGLGVPPLFKSATDKPPGETVTPLAGWLTLQGSTLPTAAAWERTFPPLNTFIDGYTGRFVYEQSDGIAASDGCYYGDPSGPAKVTNTLTGGGWFVDPQGDLGPDEIGMNSDWVSYYQNYYGPMGQTCAINTPQDLYIDTRTGSAWVPWITDTQMPAEITPSDLFVGLVPGQGELVTACEPYPKLKGKCR